MATTTTNMINLKLLVDKKNNKVLFAEASKEFVDILFYIFSLPVGTIVNLLTKENMVGSLGNLFGSIENLNANYMQPNLNKDSILNPQVPITSANVSLLRLPSSTSAPTSKKYLKCSGCYDYVSDQPNAICPDCETLINSSVTYVTPPVTNSATSSSSSVELGFVKGVVTYTVMDDLVVKPMSTISCITLFTTFNVKDIGDLEEKEVTFGMDEAVKLIKTSMESKTVLTDVFLGNKRSTCA